MLSHYSPIFQVNTGYQRAATVAVGLCFRFDTYPYVGPRHTVRSGLASWRQPNTAWLSASIGRSTQCLFGLRKALNEDLKASPTEMLFGTVILIRSKLFTFMEYKESNSSSFVKGLHHFAHTRIHTCRQLETMFFKDLRRCSRRSIPNENLYTGRIDHCTFFIDINGKACTNPSDDLNPVHLKSAGISSLTYTFTSAPWESRN